MTRASAPDATSGYGVCPLCGEHDPPGTKRERRPNGDTVCGACKVTSESAEWYRPRLTSATPAPLPVAPMSLVGAEADAYRAWCDAANDLQAAQLALTAAQERFRQASAKLGEAQAKRPKG